MTSPSPDIKLGVDEFDEMQADEASGKLADNYYNNPFKMFVEGARYQHQKLRPVIQGLRAELAKEKELNEKLLDKLAKKHVFVYSENKRLEQENEALKSEIQALKAENERLLKLSGAYHQETRELQTEIAEMTKALEYYSHPDHYTESQTLGGTRQPGVLTEGGKLARAVLNKQRGGG